jgi:chromosome partitioning protein
MKTVLVLNPKGGCGKTTIATSLAAYFAFCGKSTVVLDFDAQSSSRHWLEARQAIRPQVQVIDAHRLQAHEVPSWREMLPGGTQRAVVDTPAALKLSEYESLIEDADAIIVPVIPSEFDLRAAASLISELLLMPSLLRRRDKLAVVANRVKIRSLAFRRFLRFAERLDLPVAASLRESQNYVYAAQKGLGIHDLPRSRARLDLEQWESLLQWMDSSLARRRPARHLPPATLPEEEAEDGGAPSVLSLPQVPGPAPTPVQESPQADQAPAGSPPDSRPHALVVDDSGLVRKVTERFLSRNGFRVSAAPDGKSGLDLLEREHPDVVILDVMMPGLDGFGFTAAARNNPETRAIPIIMVTAMEGGHERDRAMQAGADDFLLKPYRESHLLASIRKLLPDLASNGPA